MFVTGRSDWNRSRKNSTPSSSIALRSSGVKAGNIFSFFSLNAAKSRACSHCVPNSTASARTRGSCVIRRACASITAGSASFPAAASANNSASGRRRPQEITQPRRLLEAVDRPGRLPRGRVLDAKQEGRRHEDAGQHRADRLVVFGLLAADGPVEFRQVGLFLLGQRPAIGAGREVEQLRRLRGDGRLLVAEEFVGPPLEVGPHCFEQGQHLLRLVLRDVADELRQVVVLGDRLAANEAVLDPKVVEFGLGRVVE